MGKIRRKMDAYVDQEMTHCGHEPGVTLAAQARGELPVFIQEEIETLANQAGCL